MHDHGLGGALFDHVGIAVSDYDRSKRFYSGALGPLGYTLLMEFEGWAGFGLDDLQRKPSFWVHSVANPPTPAHVAFAAPDRERVRAFWEAALTAGGRDNGAPGIRAHYHPTYFGAFVLDPDGHNIEAVCHAPG
jgi:catechol 2,3-dioxygenase-like lactoylglutathione lyase family enzyme